jgi:hypothetical protein
VTDIQRKLKPCSDQDRFEGVRGRPGLALKDNTMKPVEHAPSAKAKDNITRISNILVEGAIFMQRSGVNLDSRSG